MNTLLQEYSRVTAECRCPVKPRHNDIAGQRFGSRVALGRAGRAANGNALWRLLCDCGRESVVRSDALGEACPSCSSRKNGVTHGKSGDYVYASWVAMKSRCTRPSRPYYHRYRLLEVYGPWLESFEAFYEYVGDPPSSIHTIDRIDNELGYIPGNVRWATRKEQANNRRTNRILHFDGQDATLSEWSRRLGIGKTTIRERLRRGWSVSRALTETTNAKA